MSIIIAPEIIVTEVAEIAEPEIGSIIIPTLNPFN